MIRGNALFMVIVIALIIGILTASVILISYHHRLSIQQNLSRQRLELNAVSAVNYLLASGDSLSYGQTGISDLFGNGNDSVTFKRVRWGLFDVGIATAFDHHRENTKIFQTGSKPYGVTDAAIYLVDDGGMLMISGETVLKGTCYLPARGVQGTQISGFHFSGSNFVDGPVKKSLRSLPVIDTEPVREIIRFFNATPDSLRLMFDVSTPEGSASITRSFQDTSLLFYQRGPLTIEENQYTGNIIFISDTLITIENTAKLEDVLIIAPDILIKPGFTGNIQAFASDTLALGEGCKLQYPSVLAIVKNDFSEEQPSITISDGAEVSGFIFGYQSVEDLRRTLIRIGKGSKVYGSVYSDGFVEMKGTVQGGVICNKFILNTASSFYENHLLNVTIDYTSLSPHYLMPSFVESKKQKDIVKWLY